MRKAAFLVFFLAIMPTIISPVSVSALGVNPPDDQITEVYSGSDSWGSLDIYTATGAGRDEVNSTFSAPDDSSISIKMNLITRKVTTTLPGGKIVALPQSHSLINVTFTANSGQTWQVNIDGSGNMLTPNGNDVAEAAMAVIGGASHATATAFMNFTLTEGLIVQDPQTGVYSANASRAENIRTVHPFFTVDCMKALFDLIGATYGYVLACGAATPIDPLCPFAAAWYWDALTNYYQSCVWA